MNATPEQIQAAGKANVDAILSLAATQFAALEKLANLDAALGKTAFADGIANTKALLGAKDAQEFVSLQQNFVRPALDKAIAYSKSVQEILDSAYDNFAKAAKQATEKAKKAA